MIKRSLVGISLLLCAGAHSADLNQAILDAVENDPQFAQSTIAHQIAGENKFSSYSAVMPSLSVGTGRSESKYRSRFDDAALRDPRLLLLGVSAETNDKWTRTESPPGFSVSVSQSLNPRNVFNILAANQSKASADYDLRAAEQNLIVRVLGAYLSVLRAQALLDSTIASEEAVQRQLEQAQQRFDVGLTAITGVLEAKAAADDAAVARIQAYGNHGIFFESLKVITGVSYNELARLADDFPIVDPEPKDEEQWVDVALRNNPAVLSAEQNLEAAKTRFKGQLTQHLPNFSVSSSYSRSTRPLLIGGFDTGFETDNESTSVSVSVGMPLFQGGSIYRSSRVSYLSKEQSRYAHIQQKLTVERDVRNLFRTVVTDVIRVDAREKAIQSAEAALEATRTGYEVGTRNIVEVLNAQRSLFSSQYAYANSRYDYVTNMVLLRQAAGILSVEDIAAMNEYMDNENTVAKITSISGT